MRGERGDGKLGLVVWLAVIAIAIFVATRAIPVRVAVYQLHDFCEEQARLAAVSSRFDEDQLYRNILQRAQELAVPLERKQLKFERRPNDVRLNIKHSIQVDFGFYVMTWSYDETFEHIRI